MNDKKLLNDLQAIQLLVDMFYSAVRENEILGPIFNDILKDRWPAHLEKMYRFWQTVLLEEHTYHGSPFPPHANLPVDKLHFDTWLSIWHKTIDEYFEGSIADEAKWRGEKMAAMFLSKIQYYKNNALIPLI